MEKTSVYIALEQSTLVSSRKVHIGDISTVFCLDKDISHQIHKTEIMVFHNTNKDQAVVTMMKLIELITKQFPHVHVVKIGCPETIVYYKNLKDSQKFAGKIKAVLLLVLAFLGTAFSIMVYNGEVGIKELIENLYVLCMGINPSTENTIFNLGLIAYSLGLCLGMVVFFNHGFNKNSVDDPTPLQVQMRLYEDEVNKCIIIDSSRKNKSVDVN